MGAVYLADDTRLPGHKVAIKENLNVAPDAQRQFQREAVILARLRHPNLPTVTDYFIEPGGQQYLVMEYIRGENLSERLHNRGRMQENEAIACMAQLLSAIHYMHTWRDPDTGTVRAVIHRDIKPANVKLTPDGRYVLVDFGIAKLSAGTETVASARALTPGYAPLEQYHGGTDERSDVYALGATLYSLLTGRMPPSATGMATGEPLPPFRAFDLSVSKSTEAVVRKAMAVRPNERYASAAGMYRALTGRRLGAQHENVDVASARGGAGAAARRRTPVVAGLFLLATIALVGAWFVVVSSSSKPDANMADDGEAAPGVSLAAAGRGNGPDGPELGDSLVFGGGSTPTRAIADPTLFPVTELPVVAERGVITAAETSTPASTPSPTLQSTATETPTASATPAPTEPATATAEPSATATSTAEAPTATSTATQTPLPTETPPPTATSTPLPTDTPVPATCGLPVDAQLAEAWSQAEHGCALGPSFVTWASYTPYERGFVVWREDNRKIYGYFDGNGWLAVDDVWDGSSTPPSRGSPPAGGLQAPIRGTGWIWHTNDAFYHNLGWATADQSGFCAIVQNFEQGHILRSSDAGQCHSTHQNPHRTLDYLFYGATNVGGWQRLR